MIQICTGRAGSRAGPGRAWLDFIGPRAERAEHGQKSYQKRNMVYVKKPNLLVKLS